MKKIIIAIAAIFAVIGLASCTIDANTGIKFTKLPDAIYEANENADVESLLSSIEVDVNGQKFDLTNEALTVTGFSADTLKTPGSYTLVVSFGTLSVSYNYTVVAPAQPEEINTADELIAAAKKGGIYSLKNEINIDEATSVTQDLAISVENSLTIYGNGYKVYGSKATRLMNIVVDNIKVELYDLILNNNKKPSNIRGLQVQSKGVSLLLDNVEVTAYNYALNLTGTSGNLNIVVKNSTLKGWAAINCFSSYSELSVENSTLIGENNFANETFNTITIDGAGIDDEETNDNGYLVGTTGIGNKLVFKDCTIKAINNTGKGQYILGVQFGALINDIKFESCNFEYNDESVFLNNSGSGNKVTIDGKLYK